MGRLGLIRVVHSSSTREPENRTAPISMIASRSDASPVVSMSIATIDGMGGIIPFGFWIRWVANLWSVGYDKRMLRRFWWILAFVLVLASGRMISGVRASSMQLKAYIPLIRFELTRTPTVTRTPTPTPTSTQTPTPTVTPTVTPTTNAPPPHSTSLYMRTVDQQTLYNLGCAQGERDLNLPGTQDSVVVLDFGQPTDDASGYGANLFGMGPATLDKIEIAVEQFAVGYLACVGIDTTSHLRIGVGTSNYGNKVYYMHGKNWAKMVNAINTWLQNQGYFSRVDAAGASDLELGWNSPTATRDWVDGYDSSNQYILLNYGDANGCPTLAFPDWDCLDPWTQDDVWYISFGVGASYPLPLIYATDDGNAQQWYLLSLYAFLIHGTRMDIQGAFTQWQACQQFPSGCGTGLDNSPAQGWTQLWTELNSDDRTSQGLKWSTDIKWWGVP
jgi:hypothetical protein